MELLNVFLGLGIGIAFCGVSQFAWAYSIMTSPQPSWIFASLILLDGTLFSAVGLYLVVRSFRQLVLLAPTKAQIPQAKKAKAQTKEQRSVPSQRTEEANQLIAFLVALGAAIFLIFAEIKAVGYYLSYGRAVEIVPLTKYQISYIRDALKRDYAINHDKYRLQIICEPDEKSAKIAEQISAIVKDVGWIQISPPKNPDPDYRIPPGLRIFCAPDDSGALHLSVAFNAAKVGDPDDFTETPEMYRRGYFAVTISDRWW